MNSGQPDGRRPRDASTSGLDETTIGARIPAGAPADAASPAPAADEQEETRIRARAIGPRRPATDPRMFDSTLGSDGGGIDQTHVRDLSFAPTGGTVDDDSVLLAVLASGRVGRFVVVRELGRGAMGVVLVAYDEELDRKVAIKLLHVSAGIDASFGRTLLLREAQAMARLSHPNVVGVHEVGVVEGTVFLAMEYVVGVDLQHWLAETARPWREVLAVLRQAGAGLVAAHREGLVHRDFKPSNILVGEDGRVRVADFGLAARRGALAASHRAAPLTPSQMTETLAGSGALVGTPAYMAPEMLRLGEATAQSDQYAFCVTLWEALYGVRPFVGQEFEDLLAAVERHELPATPPRPEVPAWLHAAVCRGLEAAPERRFPTLAELVELLGHDPEAERAQRRRRLLQIVGAIAATAALVTLAVFGYGALSRYAAERQAEGRLAALRGQIAGLRAEGAHEEAARLMQVFVTLPENRGRPVIARAYLDWAAAQTEPAAAADAYASAYVNARTGPDERAALRGLIDQLSAQGLREEAGAAWQALRRVAPDNAAAPELRGVRLAAVLGRRDLGEARAVLADGDEEGLGPALEHLSRVTVHPHDHLGGTPDTHVREILAVDVDADGEVEIVNYGGRRQIQVLRGTPGLERVRRISLSDAAAIEVLPGEVADELVFLAAYPSETATTHELRLQIAAPDGSLRVVDRWPDSKGIDAEAVDIDGDGRREVYLGTQAFARRFWRLDRGDDGAWTRGSAHPPIEATRSDVMYVSSGDYDDDGRPELAVAIGPWRAYDLRILDAAPGGLKMVGRRSFGSFHSVATLKRRGPDVIALIKTDSLVAPGRFPPDQPLGPPNGVYIVGLEDGALKEHGFFAGNPRMLHAGDLDGDGEDELVVGDETSTTLVRWRPGEPLRPHTIGGLVPLVVHDLDGDGAAEIVARLAGEGGDVVVLGAGDQALPPLPATLVDARPLPPGVDDPAVAEIWGRAETLVTIGLPRRSAAELAAVSRLSGPVAQDMLYRTGEIDASIGDDEAAARHFEAAAARPDLAERALGGAAAARRRRGEFAAAEELTRRRLAVAEPAARPAIAAELAALSTAAAPRATLELDFSGPLDPRWQIFDPVAVSRELGAQTLSVWSSREKMLARYPLEWDGGPVALEVEMDSDRMEWGVELHVEIGPPGGPSWLSTELWGYGAAEATRTLVKVCVERECKDFGVVDPHSSVIDVGDRGDSVGKERVRASLRAFPGIDTLIRELDVGAFKGRQVVPLSTLGKTPPAGPLELRIVSSVLLPTFVGHASIRAIRLSGLTAGPAAGVVAGPAWSLVEGDPAAAFAALQGAPVGGLEQVWRVEAALRLGRLDAAVADIKALHADGPATAARDALFHRLRRMDLPAWAAAHAALGDEFGPLLLPVTELGLRASDIDAVLIGLRSAMPSAERTDTASAWRRISAELAVASALIHAGRFAEGLAALRAIEAALEASPQIEERDLVVRDVLNRQLDVLVDLADRDGALQCVRRLLAWSQAPELTLEQLQARPVLVELLGPEVWRGLEATVREAPAAAP